MIKITSHLLAFVLAAVFPCSTPLRAEVTFSFPPTSAGTYEYVSGLLCYVAGALDPSAQTNQQCLSGDSVSINDSSLSPELKSSLQSLANENPISPQGVLSWWDQAQPTTLVQRHHERLIAPTLQEFTQSTRFITWPKTVLPISMVKRRTRVIYRSPVEFQPPMSVAVTHDTQTGDLNAPVRETEIAVERTDSSGNADFYSYNHLGALSLTSEFPSGMRPAPSSCLGCHFQRASRLFPRERR